MNTSPDPYAGHVKKERNALLVALAVLAVVVVVGIGVSGLLARGQGLPNPVTQADLPRPSNVTQATGQTAPVTRATAQTAPVTQAAAEVPPEMPPDVLEWLKHLERVEGLRKDMATRQIAGLLTSLAMLSGVGGTEEIMRGLLDGDDNALEQTPSQEVSDQASVKRNEWRLLIEDFDSLPPPTECVPIRNAYAQAIGETKIMIVEVLDAISQAGDDPKLAITSLQKLKGTSAARIDTAARQTDDLVREICDRYRKRKWFDVTADIGGNMGGVLGGLGGLGR